jgi:hypothetical protein
LRTTPELGTRIEDVKSDLDRRKCETEHVWPRDGNMVGCREYSCRVVLSSGQWERKTNLGLLLWSKVHNEFYFELMSE